MDQDIEIDKLLDEVNSLPSSMEDDNYIPEVPSMVSSQSSAITGGEDLNAFIVSKGVELIESGIAAIREVQATSSSAKSPEEIEAYGDLIGSVSKSIDILNKINLQAMKTKANKEIKKMDMESRADVARLNPGINQTNNVLVATRDEFFKQLMDSQGISTVKSVEIIDIKPIEEDKKELPE